MWLAVLLVSAAYAATRYGNLSRELARSLQSKPDGQPSEPEPFPGQRKHHSLLFDDVEPRHLVETADQPQSNIILTTR